jgi:5,10-methylenetetrahydromethanopterin reductase
VTVPRFGLRCPPCAPATEVAAFAREAEQAGFDVAWVPDSQFLWRDVWATLALVATSTERIAIGTAVTNFETRDVAVTAGAAATIEELAPGRFRLGVGTGDSAVKTIGLSPTRLAQMREHFSTLRALWRGEAVDFGERRTRMKIAPARELPIYMAASGPKALALAGELADGVIVLAGMSPELIAKTVGHIREGAERAGRDPEELDICLGTFCHITDDPTEAARIVKPYACMQAQLGGTEALRAVGIDVKVPAVVEGVYPDMTHAEDWDLAVEVAGRWITDEMGRRYADAFCLVGSVDSCIAQLEAAVACGITSFYIRHFSSYRLPDDLMEAFGAKVIPHFRGALSEVGA